MSDPRCWKTVASKEHQRWDRPAHFTEIVRIGREFWPISSPLNPRVESSSLSPPCDEKKNFCLPDKSSFFTMYPFLIRTGGIPSMWYRTLCDDIHLRRMKKMDIISHFVFGKIYHMVKALYPSPLSDISFQILSWWSVKRIGCWGLC